MKSILLSTALAVFSTPALACDRVSFLFGSNHVGAPDGMFNETNPGAFCTRYGETFDLTAGVYLNSYDEISVSLTASYALVSWEDGEASLFGGLAHYPGSSEHLAVSVGDFMPIGGLQIRHKNLWAQIIPLDGKPVNAVIAGGITFDTSF